MKKRKAYVIVDTVLNVLTIIMFICFAFVPSIVNKIVDNKEPFVILIILCLTLQIISKLMSLVFYRCQHCGAKLQLLRIPSDTVRCPFCGNYLDEGKRN